MNLTLQYTDGGVEESLDVVIDALSDLTPIFARFMKWLRPEIDKVFQQQGPGWPERKESSKEQYKRTLPAKIEAIRGRALNPLQRSVLRTYRRAEKRLGKTSSVSDLYAKRQKTLAKQRRQVEEIQRINAGGAASTEKEFAKLGGRLEKYRASAEGKVAALERGELLGRIANSIRALVNGNVLTIESMIDWAGIHNDGGTAGNNARIQMRKFLEWTPDRIAKFIEIVQQYIIEKLDKASAKANPNEWVERAA